MDKRAKKTLFVGFLAVLVGIATLLLGVRSGYDYGPKINEIAFSMDSGIDWIEIYNPGLRSVSLRGMYLSDDSGELTRFEIVEPLVLGPGDYLVVYCNEYEGDTTGTTMTNFRVSQGETVYLVDSDGTTVVDSLVAILGNDVSDATIGRYPDGSDDIYMMADYTPGEANERGESLGDIYLGDEPDYDSIFNFDEVHEIRFTIEEEDFSVMQDYIQSEGQVDPSYVPSTMEFDGTVYEDIAVRYKGNSSLHGNEGIKKSLRVDVNYYSDQNLMGVQEFVLNCNFRDPSQLREAIGYSMFEQIGAPYSMTAFAEVYVNDEYIGVYTMIENVDDEYLERNFGNSDGYLFKIAQMGFSFEYFGDDPESYDGQIELKQGDEMLAWYTFCDFLEVLNSEVDDDYEEEILEVFDVYGFLDQMALTATFSHMDSYLASGRNMYIYYDPSDSKWKTLPWDLNEFFGSYKGAQSNLYWDAIHPTSVAGEENMMKGEFGNEDMPEGQLFFDDMPPLLPDEGRTPSDGMDVFKEEVGGSAVSERPLFNQLMEVPEFKEYYFEQLRFDVYEILSHDNLDNFIDELFELIDASVAMESDEASMFTYEDFIVNIDETVFVEGLTGQPTDGTTFNGLKSFIDDRSEIIIDQLDGTREN